VEISNPHRRMNLSRLMGRTSSTSRHHSPVHEGANGAGEGAPLRRAGQTGFGDAGLTSNRQPQMNQSPSFAVARFSWGWVSPRMSPTC
jgi:hypothetical protein